ncbi:HSP90 family protein [Neolewinella agarilytica]|uniref:HSP90 family protein n=1 Tax=Neolewinella agarilytica TaxID=478744 RepID=UPI00235468EE|nr:HSP90 family protein [Neolewinella agarilytica]
MPNTPADSSFNFQVNLAGIIDILANHLYSEEKVFLRELLQNATDAITARQKIEDGFVGQVRLDLIPGDGDSPAQIIFEDNGVGLTEEEVHLFLSSIGSSSKKTVNEVTSREDFIGQFGIGLLSCFMITDEIVMVTRSAKGGSALEWRGNADGSYKIRQLDLELEPGTRVYLRQKAGVEKFFQAEFLRKLVKYYGDLLPFPIHFAEEATPLNAGDAPFMNDLVSSDELGRYGIEQFRTQFFDAVPLRTSDGTTRGVAYILPYAPNPAEKTTHKVYLKRMLISEKIDNVLPDWAFFVKCIINTGNLRPTASRESFYEDEYLKQTREELGDALKNYLKGLAANRPDRMRQLISIHLATLKGLALHDDEFFDVIVDHLPFKTTYGEMLLSEVARQTDTLRHVPDLDEYRQLVGVASAQKQLAVCSGYLYDNQLVAKYGQRNRIPVQAVNTSHFIQHFEDLTVAEREATFDFLQQANAALSRFQCQAVLRKFEPANVPTIYYMDDRTNFNRSIKKSREIATDTFASMLDSLSGSVPSVSNSQLCLNYRHPLIQRLAAKTGDLKLEIEILYVQALLLGHHPLNNDELDILSNGLLQLMDR